MLNRFWKAAFFGVMVGTFSTAAFAQDNRCANSGAAGRVPHGFLDHCLMEVMAALDSCFPVEVTVG